MKKALGQTVRDLKRGVNKKVLKVPSVEQKILDATSNEPWGPHGSILADIAQATRNYHEYQMIMSVIWKRINDTGKSWRHVYKALTVLEYLVAYGSECVIDEIREHAYQISVLSDFQYIDSSGRDQGSNVRKKSQSLVVLVNDKERIEEVRQKAAANRDKYHNTSMGGMTKPGSYSSVGGYGERYDDQYEGRYGSRYEDRNGYGREREWGSRDDDRYGKYGDSNICDGDRYGRESEEHYGRDGYRDDDSRGRSRSVDDYNYRDSDRSYEDDGQYSSSRGNGAKAVDLSQDGSVAGRPLDRKYSEQNIVAPPSYAEAVGEARSPTHSERGGETSAASAPKLSSPPLNTSDQETTFSSAPAPAPKTKEFDGFDEFDPRGSFSAAPISSNGAEMDFLGPLSESFSSKSLAIVSTATATLADAFTNSGFGNGFPSESTASNQLFEDPFGDGPFRAISYTDGFPTQLENVDSTSSFHSSTNHSEPPQPTTQKMETFSNFGFGDTDILADILPPSGPSATEFPAQTLQPSLQTDFQGQINQPGSMMGFHGQPDQSSSHTSFPVQIGQPSSMTGFPVHSGQPVPQAGFPHQSDQPASLAGFPPQMGTAQQSGFPSQISTAQQSGFPAPSQPSQPGANFYGSFNQQSGSTAPDVQPMAPQIPTGPSAQYNTTNFIQQPGSQMAPQVQQAGFSAAMTSAPASSNSLAIVPQPVKDKFETKSTVWADTLNRGLVNLNISGSKTNPLADIGVDFDAINRKEKRMEKPSQTPVVSTITMGKAMGSGSGIGRAGTGAFRGAPNPMMGSGMHMGMGGAPGAGMGIGMGGPPGMGMGGAHGGGMGMAGARVAGMGMGMGAGYGVNQPMGGMGMGMNMGMGAGMNMGMGAGMNVGMGAGMNMGMGQGVQMQQQPTGFPPGSGMPGGYNPMMGTGNFSQQPNNGGYR